MFDRLQGDRRAVEGMPIRLVVAVTVGVAALSVLAPMANSVDQVDRPELTVEPEPRQVPVGSDGPATVRLDVLTDDGTPVEGATVVVSGRSLPVEGGPVALETGPRGIVRFSLGTTAAADVRVSFRPRQRRGTVDVSLHPPSGYADAVDNPDLTVRQKD